MSLRNNKGVGRHSFEDRLRHRVTSLLNDLVYGDGTFGVGGCRSLSEYGLLW